MPDENDQSATATADPGAEQATQVGAATADPVTADGGAPQANPADAATSSSESDTRSNAKELLSRVVNPSFRADTPATPSATPPVSPQPGTTTVPPGGQPANAAQPQAPVDWEDKARNLEKLIGRQSHELGQHRARIREIDEMKAKELQAAEAAKLKPWHPRHPEHQRTHGRLSAVNHFVTARDAILANDQLSPEAKGTLIRDIAAKARLTQADLDLHSQHEDHRQAIQERITNDFEGLFDEMFESRIGQKFEEFERYQNARVETQQFLQANDQVLEKHRDAVLWGMENPRRREVGVRLAQLEEENAALRAKLSAEGEEVATARARDVVTKQRATVQRDPVTVSTADPMKQAMSKNLKGEALFNYLAEQRSRSTT